MRNLFLTAVILWVAHGVEELATGFYAVDSQVKFMFGFTEKLTSLHASFLVFQIMLWLILIVSYLLILGPKSQLRLIIIPGIILVYELYHIYKAVAVGGYYPGLITALGFPIIAFLFWQQLLKEFKSHGF